MQLNIINSGSVGNCYILQNEDTALVIECGVNFSDVKKALDFNLSKVAGVLVSHEHQDHCKGVKDAAKAGLNIYCTAGTWKAMGIDSHRIKPIGRLEKKVIGPWTVMAFDVKHDAAEPVGFIIHHPECGNVLFITDTYYVAHTFSNINNVLIEANYCTEIVNQRLAGGDIHARVRDRVIESHMSLETCKALLKANDLSAVNNIVLIHLSDGNSDAKRFSAEIAQLTGKTVTVASKGITFPFNKTPF